MAPTETPPATPSPPAADSSAQHVDVSTILGIVIGVTILAVIVIVAHLVVYYCFRDGPKRRPNLARHVPDCFFPQPFRDARRARRARRKEEAERRAVDAERGIELEPAREVTVAGADADVPEEEVGGLRQVQGDEQAGRVDVGEGRRGGEIERGRGGEGEGEEEDEEEEEEVTTAFPPFEPRLDIDGSMESYSSTGVVDPNRQSSLVDNGNDNDNDNDNDGDDEDSEDSSPRPSPPYSPASITGRMVQYHAVLREPQARVAVEIAVQTRRGVQTQLGADGFRYNGPPPGARRSPDSTRGESEQDGDASTGHARADDNPRASSPLPPLPPTPRLAFAELALPEWEEQPPVYSWQEAQSPPYAEADPHPWV